ncbi:unnamed protein product [Caenorhabditis sp. 36 PRJEB53466]|nr:unnamed protein product [Caenorhabditis sp. 36 PRJEB53466]
MEYIVCNKCGCAPSKRQFFITACSHVCCEQCLAPKFDFCSLCKIPTKVLKLDGNLPKNVRKIFGDTTAMANDIHRRLAKIMAFQKEQKWVQLRIENKKAALRREQNAKMEQKMVEIGGQMAKLGKFEESTRKKLKDTETEIDRLEKLCRKTEEELASPQPTKNDDDFFLKDTPTSSRSSVASSDVNNSSIFEYDLLGLKTRVDSLDRHSSTCSSSHPGSLF